VRMSDPVLPEVELPTIQKADSDDESKKAPEATEKIALIDKQGYVYEVATQTHALFIKVNE